MSRATSLTRLTGLVEAVPGIASGAGRVHNRMRDDIGRADAEADLMGSAGINCWECELVEEWEHQGASGMNRAVGRARIIAHYKRDDEQDTYNAFTALLGLVAAAVMDPSTGFAQMREEGVRIEGPTVVKLRTQHAAWRAVLTFGLLDLVTT